MRRAMILAVSVLAVLFPASASAEFGFLPGAPGLDVLVLQQNGSVENRAGAHPHAIQLDLGFKTAGQFSDGDLRDLRLALPPGFLFNPTAVDECTRLDFRTPRVSPNEESHSGESCPLASQVGVVAVRSSLSGGAPRYFGIYNLVSAYGAPLALGFAPFGTPVVFVPRIREGDAGLTFELEDLPQSIDLQGLRMTFWGTPWQHVHDARRGNCLRETTGGSFGACPVPIEPEKALEALTMSVVTLPTTCDAPPLWTATASSWQGASDSASVEGHDTEGHPLAVEDCRKPLTEPRVQLTTDEAASGSGLVFDLEAPDGGGILNPGGLARPSIRKTIVAMPEGLTINPSLGAGLGACSQADFARESASSEPGSGCPNQSKVGTVQVEGLLGLEDDLEGSLYVATPYANPSGTLIAFYLVASLPRRGLFVKAFGRVDPDPRTGRLTVTFDDLPRLLYTHFRVSLRQGQRSPLISPPACGTYTMGLARNSWAQPSVFTQSTSSFEISRGERRGPCTAAGSRPFQPQLVAGSLNPQAGAYSAFQLRMVRSDSDQEITNYSATFPKGLLGKVAGIPLCSDAAIAAARGRTGMEELRQPSCPEGSRIGRTQAGYGVGPVLAYAPGSLYLAGPFQGAPLSTVAVNSALVGPFDLGTVVVRSAIRVDARTAQASIDSSGSDPIPHILSGIPLHLRDIRVFVDRPEFTLNPTTCDPSSTSSTLSGAGVDLFGAGDDVLAIGSQRFQALNCLALPFKPSLRIALKGGAKRGKYPRLRAVYAPRPGDANTGTAAVTLPRSLFLAQENIRDVCTRPQAEAGACPPGSVIGEARAETPLLAEPMVGPVFLRSSNNTLPDLVAELRGGGFRIFVEGRIDSHRGGIRGTFAGLPDAPVSRFTMTLYGGRKRGILVNSANLCSSPQYALARLLGKNNIGRAYRPRLSVKCVQRRKGGR